MRTALSSQYPRHLPPPINEVSLPWAQGQNILAPLPVEIKEASTSASATYLSGHKRFDFLHVETVTGVPWRKELTNHTEPPHSRPRHREAIVSDHVKPPAFPFPVHAGNCSVSPSAGFRYAGERTVQELHFPGSEAAGASIKPPNLRLNKPGDCRSFYKGICSR